MRTRRIAPASLINPTLLAVALAISGCGSSSSGGTTPPVADDPTTTPGTNPTLPPDPVVTTPDTTPITTPDPVPDTTPDTTTDPIPGTTPDVVPDTTPDPAIPDTTPDVVPDTTPDPVPVLEPVEPLDDVAAVQANGIPGLYFRGIPPLAIGSLTLNPLSVDEADSTIIPGGSIAIPVEASAPFSTIYVIANREGIDAQGYFEILLPSAVTAAELLVTYQALLQGDVVQQVDVQVGSADGSVSAINSASLQTVTVGTGELQVSVSSDKESDVDLYLIEPGGEEIYFGNDISAAGGTLDLDSNAFCDIDGVKNENITYEGVTLPTGTYTVEVGYFLDCDVGSTNYVVTVQNAGVLSTFRGTLTRNFESQVVTTFEVR